MLLLSLLELRGLNLRLVHPYIIIIIENVDIFVMVHGDSKAIGDFIIISRIVCAYSFV